MAYLHVVHIHAANAGVLPWSNFLAYGAAGQEGLVLGFLPTMCDNDGPGGMWKKISWTGFYGAYHSTSLWGKLVLGGSSR